MKDYCFVDFPRTGCFDGAVTSFPKMPRCSLGPTGWLITERPASCWVFDRLELPSPAPCEDWRLWSDLGGRELLGSIKDCL